MELTSCKKLEGGRCERPEDTIARLEATIGAQHDFWIHEEKVDEHLHWAAMFIEGQEGFRSMGKGVSPVYSRAGALAEGAEWLTARPIEQLPGYCCAQQHELENPLRMEELLAHVRGITPELLERIKALPAAQHWVDGYSLMQDCRIQVPIEYIDFISGPNGKAAGNRLEEALVHAVNEVFERRAHITVLKNRMVVPTIDCDTLDHPVLREHMEFLRGLGIEITLKDLSFGGHLPCIGAYFKDPAIPEDYQFHHFFKVGASFNREEALIRTFTEYTQGRKRDEFIDGSKSEQERILNHDFREIRTQPDSCDNFMSSFMFGFVPYRNADFLEAGEVVPFDKGTCHDDCLDDIQQAKELCTLLDKDMILVDFTHPDIGFPVVQVIIPGYSDVLPFHPGDSQGLFQRWTRSEVLTSYAR